MITINRNIQSEILMTTMEEIVPEDGLFRKIDKYIDFAFIYDKVKKIYCENNGRRKWLEKEINAERMKQGRKSFEYKDEIEEKHIKVSTTDKESGYYYEIIKKKDLCI